MWPIDSPVQGRGSGFALSHSVPPNTCVFGQIRLAGVQPIGGRGAKPQLQQPRGGHDRLYAAKAYLQSDAALANSVAIEHVLDEIANEEIDLQRERHADGEKGVTHG